MLYWDDTKNEANSGFFIVFLLTSETLFRYAQVLWVTLCIICHIYRLATVFITVLLDCTKTRQSNYYINYQFVTIYFEVLILRMKVTPSHWFFLCTNVTESKLLNIFFHWFRLANRKKNRNYLYKQAIRRLPTKPVDNSVHWLLYPSLNYGFYYSFVKLYKNTTTLYFLIIISNLYFSLQLLCNSDQLKLKQLQVIDFSVHKYSWVKANLHNQGFPVKESRLRFPINLISDVGFCVTVLAGACEHCIWDGWSISQVHVGFDCPWRLLRQ